MKLKIRKTIAFGLRPYALPSEPELPGYYDLPKFEKGLYLDSIIIDELIKGKYLNNEKQFLNRLDTAKETKLNEIVNGFSVLEIYKYLYKIKNSEN